MKKNSKGFTLIELLVVVAIIGILAAVGIVAYNGYTTSAKKSSTKTIHGQVVKYLAAESKKCEMGETSFFSSLSCTGVTRDKIYTNINTNVATLFTDKNPYASTSDAVSTAAATAANNTAGAVVISKSNTSGALDVTSCTHLNDDESACHTDGVLQDTIVVK